MGLVLYANNAVTTLAGGISSTATSMNLAGGTGSLFPNPTGGAYFVMTLQAASDDQIKEIVWVTARSGDVCTISRAQEGTSALVWLSGDTAANFWTAGSAAALVQVAQLQIQPGNYAVDTGTVNNLVITLNPSPGTLPSLIGSPIRVKVANSNTGVPTLNVNSLGATGIRNPDGGNLAGGQLVAGGIFEFIYDGTWFQLQSSPYELLFSNNTYTGPNVFTQNITTGGVAATVDPGGAQFRAIGGAYGALIRNDGSNVFFLQTASGQQTGTWNAFRPFAWNVVTGALSFDGTGAGSTFGGNIILSSLNASGTIDSGGNITAHNSRLRATLGAAGVTDVNVAPILADFACGPSNPGFQLFPSAGTGGPQMMLQWFAVGVPGNGGGVGVYNFPIAFPHACIAVMINFQALIPPFTGNVGANPLNAGQFNATNTSTGATNGCNVWAIGF